MNQRLGDQPAGQDFGGDWTRDKLSRLGSYLVAYQKIFKANDRARVFHTTYVDAFAGTGTINVFRPTDGSQPQLLAPDDIMEVEGFMRGSARVALDVELPFDEFVFVDAKEANATELERLKQDYPERAGLIRVISHDANLFLARWCVSTDWRLRRAVVFLDPFGMEVPWQTLEALAKTQAVDLWLLFPLGAVIRHLTRSGLPPEEWSQRLTRVFGTEDWRDAFYRPRLQRSFFGDEIAVQRVEEIVERVKSFWVECLRTCFAGVADNPLVLQNTKKKAPPFLLCFAASNPKGAPTAVRIARHLLGERPRKRR